MEDRLKFLEKLTLEEELFWQLKSATGKDYTLQFNRKSGWILERCEDGQLNYCKASTLRRALADHNIDPDAVSDQVTHSILSQTAYAAMFVEEAESLLGTAPVTNAVHATRSFLSKLSEAVREHTQVNAKKRLQVIKN